MHRILLVFFIFFLMGCTSSDRRIPGDVIPLNDMKLLVWDMILAGEMSTLQFGKDSTLLHKRTTQNFVRVLKVHKVSRTEFYKSFEFYQTHPILNKVLFDSLTDYSLRQRMELYKKFQ